MSCGCGFLMADAMSPMIAGAISSPPRSGAKIAWTLAPAGLRPTDRTLARSRRPASGGHGVAQAEREREVGKMVRTIKALRSSSRVCFVDEMPKEAADKIQTVGLSVESNPPLAGKTVFVTGATSGIGWEASV